jgi:RimJ/RimL family protein N-acetyltransferase
VTTRPQQPRALPLPDPPLTDPAAGIALRPWRPTPDDAAALAAAWAEAGREPGEPPEAWIAGEASRRDAGLALDLAVVVGGAAVGEVGLRNVDLGQRRAEIGWWIAAGHRGRGLATAAVRLLAAWALGPPCGLVQVWARIDPANAASAGVAAGSGFRRLGRSGAGYDVWAITTSAARADTLPS